MMKIIRILAILMCCILLFSALAGCNHTTQQPDETTSTGEDSSMDDDFFDLNMSHKPTKDDILTVHEGMSFYDVEKIIGKPHGYSDSVSHGIGYKWITVEGEVYSILFLHKDKVPDMADYFQYVVVTGEPTLEVTTENIN